MTRLAHTSAMVAVNNSLSDLSFRAIRSKVQPLRARNYPASSQQSSAGRRGKTPTSQTGAACVPSGQLFSASTGLMTAHCSFLTCGGPSLRSTLAPLRARVAARSTPLAPSVRRRSRPLVGELRHLALEDPSAFRVVAEHVEARTRRREHDRVAG